MDPRYENQKRKPLVTVEFQTELDIATGTTSRRMFVKMYFEARDSGLLAKIPDELWKTLCCLATYIDENGHCFPSQSLLAKDLGISRQHINKRIQRLLAFRFNGRPILSMTKNRENKTGGSRWANNVYQLQPITGFAIFDDWKTNHAPESEEIPANPPMSPQGDTQGREDSVSLSVSRDGDTRNGDTNQNYELTRRLNVNDFKKLSTKLGKTRGVQDPSNTLVEEILKICGDRHSIGFYQMVAERMPVETIRGVLSETKYQNALGKIHKSTAAFFTHEILRLAKTIGVPLLSEGGPRRQIKDVQPFKSRTSM